MQDLVTQPDSQPQAPARVTSQDTLMALIRKKYPDYHPVVALVDLAHLTDNESIEFGCHKEVAKYVVSVDRFVEVKSDVTKIKRVTVQLFGAPDQPKAVENARSPVLDVHGNEITDVLQKPTGVAVASAETETTETRTVRSTGPVPDDGDDAPRRVVLEAWGDGTSTGAGRFT